MISQTLSNISSSTSNPKINAKTSKHHKHKFQESPTTNTRRSHIDYTNSINQSDNLSTSSQILTKKPHQQQHHKTRAQHNVNKQFETRNRSCDSAHTGDRLQQNNSAISTARGTDQVQQLTAEALHAHQQRISNKTHLNEANGDMESRYQEMVLNFHTQNRKETHIQHGARLKQASQGSLGKRVSSSNDVLGMDEGEEATAKHRTPQKSKRIIMSDLMQHAYKMNLNIKRNDEKQHVNESMRSGGEARPHRTNNAL